MSWTNATNSIIMVFNLLHYKYRENCDWTCFPICGFEAPSFHPPSKSLLPIQVSPNWFWPKGESDLDDARYRYISTRKYTHTHTLTRRQIQMCTNIQKCEDWRRVQARLVQIFWRADWRLDAALTDLGIGRCATLCLARETGFVFFGNLICLDEKSDLSQHILAY